MTDLIITILSTCGISSIITFFLTKRKYNTEVEGNAIENADKSLDFYIKLVSDMKQQLVDIKSQSKTEYEEIKKQNIELQKQVEGLRIEVTSMKQLVCYNEACKRRRKEPKEPKVRKIAKKKEA